MQTRSADEPMTTFVLCNECGNRWKVRLFLNLNSSALTLFHALLNNFKEIFNAFYCSSLNFSSADAIKGHPTFFFPEQTEKLIFYNGMGMEFINCCS